MRATRLIFLALIVSLFGPPAAQRVATAAQSAKSAQALTTERVVHLDQPGKNDSRYAYIPFDVPARTARISISYQYDRAGGANTLDIGIFDARFGGSDTDARGFRGWSGGRRSEFFISRDEATPGYLPGRMPAGTWRLILGLYNVSPGGVDVSIKIRIETEEDLAPGPATAARQPEQTSAATVAAESGKGRPPATAHPQLAGRTLRWWSGDLHMHTVHSDGDWTIAELISGALCGGLDFICITDHNTASHHAEINRLSKGWPQTLVMRGEEITTYGGHTNAWGLPTGTWIDFRAHPGDSSRISDIAAQAHRAGALISINHPFALCGGCSWTYSAEARDFDAIEVWNGSWDPTDEQALAMWDRILQSGRRITAIASSDSHRQNSPIGLPTTHVAASRLTQTEILNAIRQGRVYLTGQAARPIISFEAEPLNGKGRSRLLIGDELRLRAPGTIRLLIATELVPTDVTLSLISNGQLIRNFHARADSQPQVIEIECQRDSYFRLEIRDQTKAVIALTNPIYFKVGTGR